MAVNGPLTGFQVTIPGSNAPPQDLGLRYVYPGYLFEKRNMIVSMPFASIGDVRTDMKDILDECFEKNINFLKISGKLFMNNNIFIDRCLNWFRWWSIHNICSDNIFYTFFNNI